MFYYVYILLCADKTYYTGITSNLNKRLEEHQSAKHFGSYTSTRLPVELVYFAQFTNVEQAISTEKQIKKWSKAKKQALINGAFDKLPNLAKKTFWFVWVFHFFSLNYWFSIQFCSFLTKSLELTKFSMSPRVVFSAAERRRSQRKNCIERLSNYALHIVLDTSTLGGHSNLQYFYSFELKSFLESMALMSATSVSNFCNFLFSNSNSSILLSKARIASTYMAS